VNSVFGHKPIEIIKVERGYQVFVNGVPVVYDSETLTFDRRKAGLDPRGVQKAYRPPTSTTPHVFAKAGDATHIAHTIGRYTMNLGDFVASYTRLVNVPGNHENWWHRNI